MSQRIKIKYSIRQLANELAIERDTLHRRFNRLNIPLDGMTNLRDIVRAMTDDERKARIEKLEADTRLADQQFKKNEGTLANAEELKDMVITEMLAPFKTRLLVVARREGFERHITALLAEFQARKPKS